MHEETQRAQHRTARVRSALLREATAFQAALRQGSAASIVFALADNVRRYEREYAVCVAMEQAVADVTGDAYRQEVGTRVSRS